MTIKRMPYKKQEFEKKIYIRSQLISTIGIRL